MVKLYLPVFNGASFLESANIPPEFDVTIVDAASTDNTVEVAEQRGWHVTKRGHKTGRVENWEYAVAHFIQTQAAWCKWLFTGDVLYPSAHAMLMKAILSAPQAKLIICEYDVIENGTRTRWKMFPETQLLSTPQTLWLTAKYGNWFGSPVGQCFHRDAVADGFFFGPWTWAADMQFCYHIAKNWPVLYLAESIGEFHVSSRKTFSTQCNALSSSVEEYLIRIQAARDYLQTTDDHAGYELLSRGIIMETETLIISRSFARAKDAQETDHLFDAIPMKQLLKGCVRRAWKKLRQGKR